MADMTNNSGVDSRSHNPFRGWDAFDRIFDEAFSRSKSRPLSPDIGSPIQYPLRTPFPEPHPYAHAGATPYISGEPGFAGSNDSLGLLGPEEPDNEDAFDKIWNEGLRKTRKSTVTASRTTRRTKRVLDGSGSNSTSTSNDNGSSLGLSFTGPPSPPPPPPPPVESIKSPKLKRRKSKVNFHDSADGKSVTATFELPGIKKSDVHVSYQNDKVVISWESITTDERMEGDRLVRERKERKYVRTLPLPEGTKFEEVKASMDGRHLILTYPKYTARRPIQVIEIKSD